MATKRVFKKTKKVSKVRAEYRKWSEWDEGDILIGKYIGSQIDSYDKPNWLIEVEDAQFSDTKTAKKLMGKTIGLNSNGKLDKAMKQVEEGDMVQIEFKGMGTIEKGKYKGKDAYDVEVDIVQEEGDEDEDENEDEEGEEEDDDGTDDL